MGCVVAENQAEDRVNHFLRSLVILTKYGMGQSIARARVSVSKHSLMVVEILRSVENEQKDIISGHLVLDDGLLDVTRVIQSRDALLLRQIDANPDGDYSAALACYEM